MGSIDNDIGPGDYGPTAISNDNLWSEKYINNKNYNTQANKDAKYIPRKERRRSISRRHIGKVKKTTYPEVVIANERYIDDIGLLTTTETSTEKLTKDNSNLTVRIKRWFQTPHSIERSK